MAACVQHAQPPPPLVPAPLSANAMVSFDDALSLASPCHEVDIVEKRNKWKGQA